MDIRTEGDSETATCEFLHRITKAEKALCSVDRSACEVCVQGAPLSPTSLNPVMPSLIWGVMEMAYPDADASTLEGALRGWAQRTVEADGADQLVPAIYACDAILVCEEGDTPQAIEVAAQTIQEQDNVHVHLHVIADGRSTFQIVDGLVHAPNVHIDRYEEPLGRWRRVHDLIPRLRTSFLAIVQPGFHNDPERLFTAIDQLERLGDQIALASERIGTDVMTPCCPVPFHYTDGQPTSTMVVRRATAVEMGGFDVARSDAGDEFIHRAACEGRSILIHPEIAVSCDAKIESLENAEARNDAPDENSRDEPNRNARHLSPHPNGAGFESPPARCDIVVPFKDSFELVRQSVDSLLVQEDAEVILHLVDDASDESTDPLFDEYRRHSNIRFYRNQSNLGPFGSFNNICDFAETPFIAVQDADDISLPNRIAHSVGLLQTAGADIVGARSELFGEPNLIEQMRHEQIEMPTGELVSVRNSRFPGRYNSGYFLENPTLVMRVSAFVELGGYGDFGEGKRNRTGVDTDFQTRAFFARASIAVTRKTLLRYRCHGNSAVNHEDSGLGSQANRESHAEMKRRFKRYAQGSFDPRWFGAMGRHRGVTRRVES